MKTDSKILIVDDIPKNIQMAMNILKNEGYKMFYAKSGEMTLKLVKEHDFDLILLDIMMPDMNGFEVCTKLKNEEKTKNIPIIFLSGKDSSQDVEQAYECGGIDYVVKHRQNEKNRNPASSKKKRSEEHTSELQSNARI